MWGTVGKEKGIEKKVEKKHGGFGLELKFLFLFRLL
jgi:hypothetical protein